MAAYDRDFIYKEDDRPDGSSTNGGHQHLGPNEDTVRALEKIRTAGSISISPELFEKIYLSPKNKVKGNVRQTFGNPTPMYVFQNLTP